MLTLQQIENTVNRFLEDRFLRLLSFPQEELVSAALAALKTDERSRIEKETELILQSREDIFLSNGKVYPKNIFFRDMEFRVVPTAAELEKAVLFPGAAFIPFVTDELFSDEFTLTDEDGESVPVIEVSAKFSEIVPAFFMLGNSGIVDYLSAESEENRQLLRGAKNPETLTMRLSAFDFSGFYRKHSFTDGDALIITVQDWAKAKFSVRIQKESAPEDAKRSFVHDFEQALLRVCEAERDYVEIPQQIAEAYLFAFEDGHDLRHRPDLSLEEYRLRMNEIGIRRDGGEWLLVPADDLDTPGTFEQSLLKKRAEEDAAMTAHEHTHCHDHDCHCHEHKHEHESGKPERTLDPDLDVKNFSISTGTLESIDAILEELNAPVNSIELAAMIYDALSNGEEYFEGFFSRLRASMELKFADDAQETAFINFLEENWEICKEYFSPAEDAVRAPLRTRLLDLTRSRIEYSVALLERKTPPPENIVRKLAAIHRDILDTLSLLNSDSRLEDQYDQLELRIGDIEDAWDDFTGDN